MGGGYFPEFGEERPTENDLLDAIAEGVAGRDRHLAAREKTLRDAAQELRAVLEKRGVDPDKAPRKEIKDAISAYQAEAEGLAFDQGEVIATLEGDEMRQPRPIRLTCAKPLVARGQLISSQPPRDPGLEPSTRAYHCLEGLVDLGSQRLTTGVTVRENTNGGFFYNHSIQENGGALANPEDTASKAGPGESEGTAYEQAIPENADGINMAVRSFSDGPRGRIAFPAGGFGHSRSFQHRGLLRKKAWIMALTDIAIRNAKPWEKSKMGE